MPLSSSTRSRLLVVALLAIPIVVLLVAAWQYRWMSDDGFINLRVVKQIEAGHGPVFNAGERVEASTSPLWVFVLTVADVLLPLRLEWIAVLLGMATTAAGIGLLLYGAVKLLPARGSGSFVVPTGIWVLVAFAPTWKFASRPFDPDNSFHATHVAGIAAGDLGTAAGTRIDLAHHWPRP